MGELVNLRRARKVRERVAQTTAAVANRVAYGRTKAERIAATSEQERVGRALDGARLDDAG